MWPPFTLRHPCSPSSVSEREAPKPACDSDSDPNNSDHLRCISAPIFHHIIICQFNMYNFLAHVKKGNYVGTHVLFIQKTNNQVKSERCMAFCSLPCSERCQRNKMLYIHIVRVEEWYRGGVDGAFMCHPAPHFVVAVDGVVEFFSTYLFIFFSSFVASLHCWIGWCCSARYFWSSNFSANRRYKIAGVERVACFVSFGAYCLNSFDVLLSLNRLRIRLKW